MRRVHLPIYLLKHGKDDYVANQQGGDFGGYTLVNDIASKVLSCLLFAMQLHVE